MFSRPTQNPSAVVASLVFVLGWTSGCAHYQPQPITVEQSFDDFEARRLAAPELGDFLRARRETPVWPPETWGLEELTFAAFYYSPTLDVARAEWGVAEGGVVSAGARPNPSVVLALGYNASTPSGGPTPWIPEAALELPLDVAGKRGLRVQGARERSETARLNVLDAAWQVRSRLRRAFLDLYLAGQSQVLLAEQEEILGEVIRILEARLAAGEASPTELTRARIDLANGRVAALGAAQAAARARSEMADALGVPPAAVDEVTLAFDELERVQEPVPTPEVRRRALLGRADLRASLAEYEASQSNLQLEIREQYPDISLGPGYQLDQTDTKWTLGLGVVLPALNRNQGPIAEALARREEAAARFLALQSRILSEVEAAAASAGPAVTQLEAADTVLVALDEHGAAAQAAYDIGEISRLEWLVVQLEATATALERLEALGQAQEALGALEDAMQTPLELEGWVLEAPLRAATTGTDGP